LFFCLFVATLFMALSLNPAWGWAQVTTSTSTAVGTTTTIVSTSVTHLTTSNITSSTVSTTTTGGTTVTTTTNTNSLYPGSCEASYFVTVGQMMIAATIFTGLSLIAFIAELIPKFPESLKSLLLPLWFFFLFLGIVLCASSLGRASAGTNCISSVSGTFGGTRITRLPDSTT
jgi:hypothetical protein